MLSGCKPQYCKTVGYTWLYTYDCKAFGSDTLLATSKSGPALKPCMQLGYKILMNKKGAMVRDSNSLQSSCKADAALVDHVRLRSCFIFPSIPVAQCTFFRAPNARHWTDQGGIEPHRHPIATWYISLKIDHGDHPIQLGKCLEMVRFEATAPLFSLRSQRATSAKLDSWLS